MSRSRSDLAKLALLLGADPLDVLSAFGGPWYEDSRFARDLPWGHDPGMLDDDDHLEGYTRQFVGRVGPSVVLPINGESHRLLVGKAVGRWDGPGALVWDAAEPTHTSTCPSAAKPGNLNDSSAQSAPLSTKQRVPSPPRS